MKFIRTGEEVKRILGVIAKPKFLNCEMLAAAFKTTPEFVQEVLPPPLKPAAEPLGTLLVGAWGKSNSVGPFRGAALYVRAVYEDIEGDYCLTMPMNTDTAILFGRETMGEPKKQAQTDIVSVGRKVIGTVQRHGIEVMRVTATPTGPADPQDLSSFINFHFKYTFAADGSGLDHDPLLVHVLFSNVVEEAYACDVELALTRTDNDVYGEIPVLEMLQCWYTPKVDMHAESKYLTTVDKEAFLPYAFFKIDPYDDYSR